MPKESVFLGIFNNKKGRSDSRWHVWEAGGGSFLVQELMPDGSKGQVTPISRDEFLASFRVISSFKPNQPLAGSKGTGKGSTTTAPKTATPQSANQGSMGSINSKPAPKPAGGAQAVMGFAGAGLKSGYGAGMGVSSTAKAKPSATYAPSPSGEGAYIDFDDLLPPPEVTAPSASRPVEPPRSGGVADNYQPATFRKVGADVGGDITFVKGQYVPPSGSADAAKFSDEGIAGLEDNLREDFSMALIRLNSSKDEALDTLREIIRNRGPFKEEQKFMFTEFGVAMRRRKLFTLAEQFHEKARALSPADEHILFNLARVCYDAGKFEEAKRCLKDALKIAPDFSLGQQFLDYLKSYH